MDMTTAWVPPMLAAQRLFEIWLSARNRRRLLARGGVELRPETHRTMVGLHVLFLASLTLESHPWSVPLDPLTWGFLAALAAVTFLRYWAIFSLGEFWNTRVIVVPGARVVRSGPYRFLRHPNYMAIVLEFLILPALVRAPATLVLFSAANLAVLRQRIRIEEGALIGCTDYADRFAGSFVLRNPENGYNASGKTGINHREGSIMVGTPRKSAESEEEYFARLEFERRKRIEEEKQRKMAAQEKQRQRDLHFMHCPKCGMELIEVDYKTLKVDRCSSCDGVWMDAGELEAAVELEKGLLGRIFGL